MKKTIYTGKLTIGNKYGQFGLKVHKFRLIYDILEQGLLNCELPIHPDFLNKETLIVGNIYKFTSTTYCNHDGYYECAKIIF